MANRMLVGTVKLHFSCLFQSCYSLLWLDGWLTLSLATSRVFKFGAVLLLLSVLMNSIYIMLLGNFPSWSLELSGAVVLIPYSLGFVGFTACIVTSLQLGLDQMPDASSSNITSFIKWFVFLLLSRNVDF